MCCLECDGRWDLKSLGIIDFRHVSYLGQVSLRDTNTQLCKFPYEVSELTIENFLRENSDTYSSILELDSGGIMWFSWSAFYSFSWVCLSLAQIYFKMF